MAHDMVNGSGDFMVETPVGRLVGSPAAAPNRCPRCGGYNDFKNSVPDDCGTHGFWLRGFLQPGRRVPLPYEVKDAVLLALFRLGPTGGFRHQLIDILPLSPEALDGALRRSRRSNHVVRSQQREQLPVRGTAHRHKLSWRGLAYLWERFGLQFET
jgi:hypothetical protein